MLTAQQKQTFAQDGLLHLPGLIDTDLVTKVRVLLWRHLESRLICRDDPGSWPRGLVSKLQAVSAHHSVQDLCVDSVWRVAGDLLGAQSLAGTSAQLVQLLVSFPDADNWQVPAKMWHLDIPRLTDGARRPGVQPFFFLDEVAPGGGGTVVVAGSHRLLVGQGQRIASADVKVALAKRYDWFADLMNKSDTDRDRFLQVGGNADDVPVRVVELTGKPGDVVLMDMRALHAPAPNASGQPRLMATARLIDQDLVPELYGA